MTKRYDIVVVGAGPAGASAAYEASKLGTKVLLLEKRKVVGEPVQCAEFVPKLLSQEVKFTADSIAQEINSMKTYIVDGDCFVPTKVVTRNDILGKCFETQSPGYILNRAIFDKELVQRAQNIGVDVLLNTLCISKTKNGIIVNTCLPTGKKNGKNLELYAKVIIGADGPQSTVGSWVGETNTTFVTALQYEMPLTTVMDWTEVYFDHKFVGGYGWLFPKGKIANVGIGIKQNTNYKFQIPNLKDVTQGFSLELSNQERLSELLEYFVDKLKSGGKLKGSQLSVTGGLIPVGGPLKRTYKENTILVGDAAGQTHPITGGGIPQAVICGKIAGRVAAKSIREGNLDILSEYEHEWRKIFGAELTRACVKRKFMEDCFVPPFVGTRNDFWSVVRKCWVAFKEYYNDE
ncbi:MAG: NAD(P)/FAD-dependent oxidoreductase [bacterium]|nr:NAD(P)/FAD-dependent oxidoreductase [bacterium]